MVVGAGIVGLSIALRLQMDGMDVTVVEQQEPMGGCSSGNAGYLSVANVFPPAARDLLRRIPRLLLSPAGPLVVRGSYLPRLLPWALRALRASTPAAAGHVNRSMAALMKGALAAFDDLLAAASARDLVDRRGGLIAFRTAGALAAKAQVLPLLEDLGIRAETVTARGVHELEPALARGMAGGIFFPGAGRCLSPRQLGLRYLERLAQRGMALLRGRVVHLGPAAGRVTARLSDGREIHAARAVVCTGFEAGPLQALLGFRLPLASERGYHLMLPRPGVSLRRPVVFGEPLFAATSMQEGLRLAGTAEFAAASAPPAMQRAHMLLPLARSFLPQLDGAGAVPWMGVRPSLPDGMPAIGALAAQPAILYAVGHSHNGLTTSAITAQCISALVGGRPAPVDLQPFAIERFSS